MRRCDHRSSIVLRSCCSCRGKTAIAEPYYVPSGSMEPTLQIGDELLATKFPVRLQLGVAAAFRHAAGHAAHPRRAAAARRRRRVSLAGRPVADLGQARRRPAGRPHRDARRPLVDQRRAGRAHAGRHRRRSKPKTARCMPAARFIETLPGGRSTRFSSIAAIGRFDDMAEIVVPRRPSVRHGRQSRQLGRQPGRRRRRRRRPAAGHRSGRPRRRAGRLVGSGGASTSRSGHGRRACGCRVSSPRCSERSPIDLPLTAPRRKCSTAAGAAA